MSDEVIIEATGLDMEGMKFYRDRKLSNMAIDEFVDSTKE